MHAIGSGTPTQKHLHTWCLRPGPPRADPEPQIQVQVTPRSTAESVELRQVGTGKSQEACDLRGTWGTILLGEKGEGEEEEKEEGEAPG